MKNYLSEMTKNLNSAHPRKSPPLKKRPLEKAPIQNKRKFKKRPRGKTVLASEGEIPKYIRSPSIETYLGKHQEWLNVSYLYIPRHQNEARICVTVLHGHQMCN